MLLEDEGYWLWSEETNRESAHLLIALTPHLNEAEQLELETAVLDGPPNTLLEGLEPGLYTFYRDKDIWFRLAKIAQTGVTLCVAGRKRLAELSAQYPNWQLVDDERDDFTDAVPESAERREFVAAPQELNELVDWLKEEPKGHVGDRDGWRERCREDFAAAAEALSAAAAQGTWPVMRWRTALHAWSEGTLVKLAWEEMAPALDKAPMKFLSEARHVLAWWLREVADTFEGGETTFLSLCARVLRLEYDREEDTDDVVGRAINHPIGRVTHALLRWWYRTPLRTIKVCPRSWTRSSPNSAT